MRTTLLTTPAPSKHSMRSDKLPNSNLFIGKREELRLFVLKISQKLRVNADRYLTPTTCLTYILSQLSSTIYSQILPYINSDRICRLTDYPNILRILKQAYGDLNRINNARTELLQLCQKNQEFSAFFAEFQRLALEGELADDALSTILDNAISRELRGMLIHSPLPIRDLNTFVKHLQDLKNRRRQYSSYLITTTNPIVKTYPMSRMTSLAPPYTTIAVRTTTEPIDLSNTRRYPNKETSNYFCYY